MCTNVHMYVKYNTLSFYSKFSDKMTEQEDTNIMTDSDLEKALDALREQDSSGEVGELLSK